MDIRLSSALHADTDLILEKIIPEDAEVLFSLIQKNLEHLDRWREHSWKRFTSADFLRAYIPIISQERIWYGIKLKGELVGIITLLKRIVDDEYELGYWISIEHCGKGYATAAVETFTQAVLIGFVAKEQPCHIIAIVRSHNIASQKVLRNAGFEYQYKISKDDQIIGTQRYAKSKPK